MGGYDEPTPNRGSTGPAYFFCFIFSPHFVLRLKTQPCDCFQAKYASKSVLMIWYSHATYFVKFQDLDILRSVI